MPSGILNLVYGKSILNFGDIRIILFYRIKLSKSIKELLEKLVSKVYQERKDIFEGLNLLYIFFKGDNNYEDHGSADIYNKVPTVIINLSIKNINEISDSIEEVLVHEIAHIGHTRGSENIRRSLAKLKNIQKKLQLTSLDSVTSLTKRNFLKCMRLRIANLFNDIILEGIAIYADQYSRESEKLGTGAYRGDMTKINIPNFKSAILVGLHEKADKDAKEFIFEFIGIISKEAIGDYLVLVRKYDNIYARIPPHMIGACVIYTILYCNENLTLSKVSKMAPFTLIELYESSAKKLKLRPIVSVTSGKGILDYKRLLKQLEREYTKTVK